MHELQRRHVLQHVGVDRMHKLSGRNVFERVGCECVHGMPGRTVLTKRSQLYDFDLLGMSGEHILCGGGVRGVRG